MGLTYPVLFAEFTSVKMKVSGTYELVRTQEDCDWLAQWFGKEMCDKMVGCKMVIHIKELPNNKIACQFIVEKFPELNCTTLTTEGVVNHFDAPIYGGKASLTYKRTEKGYQSVVESQTTGKWE